MEAPPLPPPLPRPLCIDDRVTGYEDSVSGGVVSGGVVHLSIGDKRRSIRSAWLTLVESAGAPAPARSPAPSNQRS